MKKRLLILVGMIGFAIYAVESLNAQTSSFFGNLKSGSFGVGFKVANAYDYSRVYPPMTEVDGKARPVQILIWYPSEKGRHTERLILEDYVNLYLTEDKFRVPTMDEQDENVKMWSNIFSSPEEKDVAPLKTRTAAMKDAQIMEGRFPLIVYGAGAEGEAFENFILCEYLASHGYIVAASPSIGMYSHKMILNSTGLETQIRDMEFIIGFMHDFPSIDTDRLAAMGWSWGGLAAMLLQMRNPNVDAVLSLDGAIALHEDKAARSPFFNTTRMRVPYLFISAKATLKELTHFFGKIKYSDAYLLGFHHMSHNDFSAYSYAVRNLNPDSEDADLRKKRMGDALICRYALHFFNASLKDDRRSIDFLNKPVKGETAELLTVTAVEALPLPPTEEAFFEIVEKEGFEKAYQFYKEVKFRDPEYIPFEEFNLTDLAFTFFNDLDRREEAIQMMKLNIEEFSDSHKSHGYLARLYEKNKDLKNALVYFSMAYGMAAKLKIKPVQDMAWYQRRIKKLKELI